MLTLAIRAPGDTRQKPLDQRARLGFPYRALLFPPETFVDWAGVHALDLEGNKLLQEMLGTLLTELGADEARLLPRFSAPQDTDTIVKSCRLQGPVIGLPPGIPFYRNLSLAANGTTFERHVAFVGAYQGDCVIVAHDTFMTLLPGASCREAVHAMAASLEKRKNKLERTRLQVLFSSPTSATGAYAVQHAAHAGFSAASQRHQLLRNGSFAFPRHSNPALRGKANLLVLLSA